MKLTADRPLSDPDKAARKLVEIANTVEAVQDRRKQLYRMVAGHGKSGERKRAGRAIT